MTPIDLSVILGEPQLAKLLEGYGERLQMSVFEGRLQPHQLAQDKVI